MPFADIAYLPQQQSALHASSFSFVFLIFLSLTPLVAHSFAFPAISSPELSCLLASSISSSGAQVSLTSLSDSCASLLHVRFLSKEQGMQLDRMFLRFKQLHLSVLVYFLFMQVIRKPLLITTTHISMDLVKFHMIMHDCCCVYFVCLFFMANACLLCMTSFCAGEINCWD